MPLVQEEEIKYTTHFYFEYHIFTCFLLQNGDHVPLGIKNGDTVLLPEYGGQKVELDDTEFHLFRESDILAKVQQ